MAQLRVLTGIQSTGTPHVGNLVGAIRPGLRLADEGNDAMYFIADYHALTSMQDGKDLRRLTREVAATWLASGLDPSRVLFYRQSDIPEILELTWVLICYTAKGWMNKAHSYKAMVAKNLAAGAERGVPADEVDVDAGINMGVYDYPILMAADIVAFDADIVPVGKDQQQHVEIARDIAERFNHTVGKEVLRIPQARIDPDTGVVPGLDGRKMSKSYGNTIPLFAPRKELQKIISRIETDSTPPEAPKDPDTSIIFQIYRAIASPDDARAFADRMRAGIGWGDAKRTLFEKLDAELAAGRDRYNALMAEPDKIDALLAEGAARARPTARRTLDRVRAAIGL